ncbi:DUF885 domain-containing protein [Candidatus Marinimicrobia bacterium MT.SAG.2]|nr:DUF885 domain-containing protein [Candidatus Marinimicrobia bacterium MT.SAG.2]
MNRYIFISTLLIGMLLSFSCQKEAVKTEPASSAGWDSFVTDFMESYFVANPTFAVAAGRHEFDGVLPDWSPATIDANVAKLHSQRHTAMAFESSMLSDEQRFEREYLVSIIDKELFQLDRVMLPYNNPLYYYWQFDPDVYISREYAPLEVRMAAYTKYANALPLAVEQAMTNLKSPMPRTFANLAHTAFGGLAKYYRDDVPTVFAEVGDSILQSEFTAANELAIEAMTKLDDWVVAQLPDATEDFALGAELYQEMLGATERVDVPIAELKKVGEADLQRNLDALQSVCAEYAPEATIHDCIAKMRSMKNEGGAVEGARQQLEGLRTFLIDNEVVSIPGTEIALVDEAPSYASWNFAYINIPGPYEEGLPSVYYIAPPDESWSEEQKNDYLPGNADLLFVSVHEIWPGHFLQFLHSNRSRSRFGQVFVGYAFAEGWAHYTEEMMWEAGYSDGDPEIHIGQLQNALLRNVRLLSSIGMHTEGMTVEESYTMFREKAYQDHGNAEQQSARGTYDPPYLNYTMGKLMIRKLREDWMKANGTEATWKEFHDKFLSFGGPPIPLIRKAMLGDEGNLF